MTWTLEDMQRFVLATRAEVPCPSCQGSHMNGSIHFRAALVLYPEFNDVSMQDQARVGVDVLVDRQSCFCHPTPEEVAWCRKEAHKIISKMFYKAFAQPELSSPPSEASAGYAYTQAIQRAMYY